MTIIIIITLLTILTTLITIIRTIFYYNYHYSYYSYYIEIRQIRNITAFRITIGTSVKCIFIHEITLLKIFFSIVILLYSIFSISFSQEEPIHDFFHLLRIRSRRAIE